MLGTEKSVCSDLFDGAQVNAVPLDDPQVRRQQLVAHGVHRASEALLQDLDHLRQHKAFSDMKGH